MASDCIRIAPLFGQCDSLLCLEILGWGSTPPFIFFSGKWLWRMAAFQDYETAADGNGSVIIKLSTVSLSFFFPL